MSTIHRFLAQPAPWRKVIAAADKHNEAVRRLFVRAANKGKQNVDVEKLAAALKDRDEAEAFRAMVPGLLIYERVLRNDLPRILFQTLVDAGLAATDRNGSLLVLKRGDTVFRFDKTNPKAAEWARNHAAKLVSNVSGENRDAIRNAITNGFDRQVSVQSTAKTIRGFIGLTSRDTQAVLNRFKKDQASVGDVRAFSRADKYAEKLKRSRALTIARTETIRAANEGQVQLWEQAVKKGFLTGQEQRQWITTENACPICGPLEGQTVGLREAFKTSVGNIDGPPAHPRCRCAQGLSLRKLKVAS